MVNENYELKRIETKRKDGKYLYQICKPNGEVVAERRSNRIYVAATIWTNGEVSYHGRPDLATGRPPYNGMTLERFAYHKDVK